MLEIGSIPNKCSQYFPVHPTWCVLWVRDLVPHFITQSWLVVMKKLKDIKTYQNTHDAKPERSNKSTMIRPLFRNQLSHCRLQIDHKSVSFQVQILNYKLSQSTNKKIKQLFWVKGPLLTTIGIKHV